MPSNWAWAADTVDSATFEEQAGGDRGYYCLASDTTASEIVIIPEHQPLMVSADSSVLPSSAGRYEIAVWTLLLSCRIAAPLAPLDLQRVGQLASKAPEHRATYLQ